MNVDSEHGTSKSMVSCWIASCLMLCICEAIAGRRLEANGNGPGLQVIGLCLSTVCQVMSCVNLCDHALGQGWNRHKKKEFYEKQDQEMQSKVTSTL